MKSSELWKETAACLGLGPLMWFDEDATEDPHCRERRRRAKEICAGCPVGSECLEYALRSNEKYGIWGGLEPRERVALKRRRRVTEQRMRRGA